MQHLFRRYAFVTIIAFVTSGCCIGGHTTIEPVVMTPPELKALGQKSVDTYIAAINTNKIEAILAELTADIVFLPPNEPALVGKPAIQKWGTDFLTICAFHEEQTAEQTVVVGDLMFVRYAYKQTITPRAGGATMNDTGKGVLLFHKEGNGRWRVAQDAWNSDLPAAK